MLRGGGAEVDHTTRHVTGLAQQRAVDPGQSLLVDVAYELRLSFRRALNAELDGDQFRGAFSDAVGQIGPGDHQVLAGLIDTADDDVGVRMRCVEVIDRDPVQPGSKIALDQAHETAGERAAIGQLGPVLRGDDQAELTRVAL